MQPIRRISIINARTIGFTIAFAIVGAMLLITGCGGGGGDGVSVNYNPSLPAGAVTLDTGNAIIIAEDAVGSRDTFASARADSSSKPSARELVKLINDQVSDTRQKLLSVATGAAQTLQCIDGDPASGTIKIIFNSTATNTSFSLEFTDCDQGVGIIIDGIISSIGNINNTTSDYSVQFGGDVTFTFTSDFSTLSMVMSASETGNEGTSAFSALMDYSVIDPLGSYLVTTTQPLVGNNFYNEFYIGGEIIIEGGGGTRLRIKITATNVATVELDDGLGFVNVVDAGNPITITPCEVTCF